ncbi:S8 family serine peptidase [Aquabacterium sp. A7-Y]|uniref:S8 family serine peptidase n=1 Tax=Aquabacterium sp. A7-Y TaxID=1349605 RepID=UPI00223E81DE|nr:S8 family serine peptidase [Aquabacterium sp. A7-Y]MCW7541963.1 S8 family serine peptidase [Aquabacterium sp. A7-Y]
MKTRQLRQQVERILDDYPQRTVSVILQGDPAGLQEAIARAAREALQLRAVTQAADLLPPPAPERRLLAERPREARGESGPLAEVRRAGTAALQPMQEAAFLNNSRLARRSDERGRPRPLPLAGAAVMEMDRDDLAQLPTALPGALAVFPNRRIAVPPRLKAKQLPPEVARRSTHTWGLESCGALAAWGGFDARGQGVRVAVLDTGVEAEHPDLRGKVARFAEFDAKGRLVKEGVDQAWDADGHGTHVCGTVAGGNASGRWIGMAPEARLLVAKVLGRNGGTDEQILKGLEWAVANGADVVNLSLGGLSFEPGVLDTYTAAIVSARAAGVPVVAAIGNDGAQTTGSPGNDFFALAVGATDVHGRVAAFSGGRTQVVESSDAIELADLPLVYAKPDLSAPGVHIYSCMGKGKWEHLNGTSMATPHVAGAIALLLSRTGATRKGAALLELGGIERSEALVQLVLGSVRDLGENGQDHRYGYGGLDALAAYGNAVGLGYLPRP